MLPGSDPDSPSWASYLSENHLTDPPKSAQIVRTLLAMPVGENVRVGRVRDDSGDVGQDAGTGDALAGSVRMVIGQCPAPPLPWKWSKSAISAEKMSPGPSLTGLECCSMTKT